MILISNYEVNSFNDNKLQVINYEPYQDLGLSYITRDEVLQDLRMISKMASENKIILSFMQEMQDLWGTWKALETIK